MLWCSSDAIIIVNKNSYMIVGPNIIKITMKKASFFSPEIDGVRIITKKRNEFLRKCP